MLLLHEATSPRDPGRDPPVPPEQADAGDAGFGDHRAPATAGQGMDLHIQGVSKGYAGTAALDGIDLHIASGELVALLGPSGSGKTTLLRVIAGLLPADRGRVLFGERDATRLNLRERNVGFVFQHYALFRHMTVAENIAFGLRSRPRSRRPDKATIQRRVEELLTLIQLADLGGRYPDQLSGGQKQRVALARALAIDPTVLLLDEPFGALDAFTREELWCTLRDLWQAQRFNVILVTHDLRESVFLADTVYVMSKSPGRFVVRRTIDLPRPRDLEITYTKHFTETVHELRGHIGAMRQPGAEVAP